MKNKMLINNYCSFWMENCPEMKKFSNILRDLTALTMNTWDEKLFLLKIELAINNKYRKKEVKQFQIFKDLNKSNRPGNKILIHNNRKKINYRKFLQKMVFWLFKNLSKLNNNCHRMLRVKTKLYRKMILFWYLSNKKIKIPMKT